MCLERWPDSGDGAIGDLVRAAGVCLARAQLGATALRDGNAELVGGGAAACLPLGVCLAREHGDDGTPLRPCYRRSAYDP